MAPPTNTVAPPTNTVAPPTNTVAPTATATSPTQGLVYGTVLLFDDSVCDGCKIGYVAGGFRWSATASSTGYYQLALTPGFYQVQYFCPVGGGLWVDVDDGVVLVVPGPQEVNVYFGFCG